MLHLDGRKVESKQDDIVFNENMTVNAVEAGGEYCRRNFPPEFKYLFVY